MARALSEMMVSLVIRLCLAVFTASAIPRISGMVLERFSGTETLKFEVELYLKYTEQAQVLRLFVDIREPLTATSMDMCLSLALEIFESLKLSSVTTILLSPKSAFNLYFMSSLEI